MTKYPLRKTAICITVFALSSCSRFSNYSFYQSSEDPNAAIIFDTNSQIFWDSGNWKYTTSIPDYSFGYDYIETDTSYHMSKLYLSIPKARNVQSWQNDTLSCTASPLVESEGTRTATCVIRANGIVRRIVFSDSDGGIQEFYSRCLLSSKTCRFKLVLGPAILSAADIDRWRSRGGDNENPTSIDSSR